MICEQEFFKMHYPHNLFVGFIIYRMAPLVDLLIHPD